MKRQICGILIIFAFFASLPLLICARQNNQNSTPKPAGRLIDIGGYRLHINCTGKGKQTVVIESGAGDFSFDWNWVQPEVAKFTRVCTYDRAGYAWSEAGPMPRTMQQIAAELYTGLKKAGVKGEIVLVGHSLGGLIARVYAKQYPKEVAGMILIDSSHEDNQIMLNGKVMLLRETSRGRTIPSVQLKILPSTLPSSIKETQQPSTTTKINPPFDKLPADIQQIRLWATVQPNYNGARNSEFDYLAEEVALMHDDRSKGEYPLGEIPLIVLTRGKNASSGHQKLQADLVRLSRNSKQIIAANSGHHIHLDEPELVINAVRQVVDSVRKRTKLKP